MRSIFAIALLTIVSPAAARQDWPQWRGPKHTGITASSGSGAPVEAWRAPIGRGYSSPSVAQGRVVIHGYFEGEAAKGEGVDRVTCLDLQSGKELWRLSYPALAYANEHRGGALSTPSIAEGVVYVASRAGELRAIDLASGELRWVHNLTERHELQPGRYGFASSPLVLGERIHLNLGRPLALDRADGSTLWIGEDLEANYSTSATMQLGGQPCLAVFGGKGLAVVDETTGEQLALQAFRKGERNVEGATPIVLGTRVFVSSAYDHGGMLVEFAGDGPTVLWRSRSMRTKMSGAVFFKGCFYGFDESMLRCIDLKGQDRWRVRGLGQGALSIAGGELIATTSSGELTIGAASPDGFQPAHQQPVIDGGVFWTSPVVLGRRILMRGSAGELVCLERDPKRMAPPLAGPLATTLPSAEEVLTRYREATGLDQVQSVPFVRLEGQLAMNALGLVDVKAVWELLPGEQWHVEMGLPPGIGGSIHRYFDGVHAWETNPYRGDSLIEDHRLDELRSTGGMRSMLRVATDYAELRAAALENFSDQACVRLDATLEGGGVRQLYFALQSGLYVGRSGPDEAIVQVSDWRPVEGLRLPFRRVVFDPDTGLEERWSFESASLGPTTRERLALPGELSRSQEEEQPPQPDKRD